MLMLADVCPRVPRLQMGHGFNSSWGNGQGDGLGEWDVAPVNYAFGDGMLSDGYGAGDGSGGFPKWSPMDLRRLVIYYAARERR